MDNGFENIALRSNLLANNEEFGIILPLYNFEAKRK